MNVLSMVKYYPPSKGGMENFVQLLSEGFSKEDINVQVVAFNHETGVASFHETTNGVKVFRIKNKLKLFSQPFDFKIDKELKPFIEWCDIIHLNSPCPNFEMALRSFCPKPLIVTWHADPAATRWNKVLFVYKHFLGNVLKCANKIVVTSPNLLKHSCLLTKHADKCEIIPYGFMPRIRLEDSFGRILEKEKPVILFVGLLRPYKGVKYLIRAMPRVKNASLKIIGYGEEKQYLQRLVCKMGLGNRVSFSSDEELMLHYKSASIFVLPSISAAEAFGIVQLEAMAHGLPVINTELPSGVPFVSLNNVTGITVPPRDENALADAINTLLSDEDLYRKYSENALVRAREFTAEKMIDRYLKLFREVTST